MVLRAGALPASLKVLEERTVGPTLGQQSIEAGVLASLVGIIGITVFMLSYYRKAGGVAMFWGGQSEPDIAGCGYSPPASRLASSAALPV